MISILEEFFMKAKSLRLLALPLLLAISGCSDVESGTYFMCISNKTNNSISKSYDKFTGKSTFKREFRNETTISVTTTTKSGNLIVKVTNRDTEEEYYSGNFTEDFDFSVNVPSGKYTLYVEGNEHSGSYTLSWANKK